MWKWRVYDYNTTYIGISWGLNTDIYWYYLELPEGLARPRVNTKIYCNHYTGREEIMRVRHVISDKFTNRPHINIDKVLSLEKLPVKGTKDCTWVGKIKKYGSLATWKEVK